MNSLSSFFSLKSRPVQLFLILAVYLTAAPFVPEKTHLILYTISTLIREVILWLLPIVVAFYIAYTIASFRKRALLFIAFLILFEFFSNLCSIWYAFAVAHISSEHLELVGSLSSSSSLNPLYSFPFSKPLYWSASKGSFAGLLIGYIATIETFSFLRSVIEKGKAKVESIITKFLSRLLPLFILGFVAKIYWTKLLSQTVSSYLLLLFWLVLSLSCYLFFLFFLGNRGSLRQTIKAIKNLLTPGFIAFSSGCSISTMPWTIEATSKNLKNPSLAQAIIPATTNVQQVGDAIVQCFLCFLIYRSFYGHPPELFRWIQFATIFALARFATAAVLGGAIFIMIPIYEEQLSFNPEMTAIILAFNTLFDPIITASNVVANAALCSIFEQTWNGLLNRLATLFPRWNKKIVTLE